MCAGQEKYREENPTAMSDRSKAMWDSLSEEEKTLRIAKWKEHSQDWKYTERGREVARRNLEIWNSALENKDSGEYKRCCVYAMKGN